MLNFKDVQFFETPYSHIVIENFLTDSQEVCSNWNNTTWVEEYKIRLLNNYTSVLKEELSKFFKNFDHTVELKEIITNTHTYPELKLIRNSHLDGPDKKYNGVIYLDEVKYVHPNYAGSFQIMESLDDTKQPIKTIEYKHNRAIFFECKENSFHRFWSRPPIRTNFSLSFVK